MKKTRLTVVMSLSLLTLSHAHSAQYRVVAMQTAELGESSFPTAINDLGDMTVNLQSQYSPSINVDLIDFESATVIAGLTNLAGAEIGDLNDYDYAWLYAYIVSNNENQQFQQIASLNSYVANDSTSELIHGFDTINSLTKEYNNSSRTQVRGLNNFGYSVGVSQDGFYTLPYITEDVVDVTYVINDFYTRGFALINDKMVELPPPEITAGGLSDAYDINFYNQVVGYGTTELASDALQSAVEACADPDERGDIPEGSCLRALSIALAADVSNIAQRRGIIWQVDERGNVTDTFELGMLIEPDSADTAIYSSTAVAINDYGVAVGSSPAYYLDTSSLTTAVAIYIDDQVTSINQDEEVFLSSASDVNNDNLVVGYSTKSVLGISSNKFFVHDIDADLTTYPDDFFLSSSSVATAINNQGMVVGYGENEVTTTGDRRTEGFIYDFRNDIFTGLNSLLECDSPYYVVQANAINDDNEIAATVLIKKPQKDINGNIIYDSLGAATEVDYVMAVKLEPISGGSVDNCNEEAEEPRQGASFSWLLILGLFGVVICRKGVE